MKNRMKKAYLILCLNIVLQIIFPFSMIILSECNFFFSCLIGFINGYCFATSVEHFRLTKKLYKLMDKNIRSEKLLADINEVLEALEETEER